MNIDAGEIFLIMFFELILLPLQIYIPYGGCIFESLWVLSVAYKSPIFIVEFKCFLFLMLEEEFSIFQNSSHP
jgi:hypothetical protein